MSRARFLSVRDDASNESNRTSHILERAAALETARATSDHEEYFRDPTLFVGLFSSGEINSSTNFTHKSHAFNGSLVDEVTWFNRFITRRYANQGYRIRHHGNNDQATMTTVEVGDGMHNAVQFEQMLTMLGSLVNTPHDSLSVLYYTGHSNQNGDLCFAGTGQGQGTSYTFEDFKSKYLKLQNKTIPILLIVDSCFSGNWALNLYIDEDLRQFPIGVMASSLWCQTSGTGTFINMLWNNRYNNNTAQCPCFFATNSFKQSADVRFWIGYSMERIDAILSASRATC